MSALKIVRKRAQNQPTIAQESPHCNLPLQSASEMTYTVSGGALNSTQSNPKPLHSSHL